MFLSMLPDLDYLPQFSIQTISRIFHNALSRLLDRYPFVPLSHFPVAIRSLKPVSNLLFIYTRRRNFKQYSNKKKSFDCHHHYTGDREN